MQILALRHNSTNKVTTDFTGQQYREICSVNGDTVLIAAQFFQQDLDGTEIETDLTGVLALRANVGLNRQEGTTLLAFQDVYNNGDLPANEVLANGRVTWLLSLSSAELTTALDTNEFVDVVLEFTALTADNLPQTLAQIGYRVYAQVDDGAVGSPPPSSPTYLDATTALATFVQLPNYIAPTVIVADGPISPVDGIQTFFVDPGGATRVINLPDVTTVPDNFVGRFLVTGTGVMRITPNLSDTINGTTGAQDFPTQFTEVILVKSVSGWINPMLVTV